MNHDNTSQAYEPVGGVSEDANSHFECGQSLDALLGDVSGLLRWLKDKQLSEDAVNVMFAVEGSSRRVWRWINVDVFFEKCLQYFVVGTQNLLQVERFKPRIEYWGDLHGEYVSLRSLSSEEKSVVTLNSLNQSLYPGLSEEFAGSASGRELQNVSDNSLSSMFSTSSHREALLDDENNIPEPLLQEQNHWLWIQGRAVLLRTQPAIARAYAAKGFKQGVEFVLDRTIHTVLLGFLGYQLFFSKNALNAIEIYRNADAVSIRNMIHLVAKTQLEPVAKYLLILPFAWGGLKAIYLAYQSKESPTPSLRESAKYAEDFGVAERCCGCLESPLWNDAIRWFLPLHPLDGHVNFLKYSILWDGRLTHEQRARAFEAILALLDRAWYTPIAALHLVAKIAQGHALSQLTYLEDSTVEALLKIKMQAFDRVLYDATHFGGVYGLYARYLRWSLGASPSTLESSGFLIFKLSKLVLKVLFFREVVKAIISYLQCPDRPGFTYHGFASWSSDYTLECFNAYIRLFNQIPGQPLSTLTAHLDKFHLPPVIDLDFSGKGLRGEAIATIISDLADRGVSVRHLNISGNSVNWPEDVYALVPQLTSVVSLDWSYNQLAEATKTGWGAAFADCASNMSQLQSLYLNGRYREAFKPLKLEEVAGLSLGLSKLGQLAVLHLSNLGIGSDTMSETIALAQALGELVHLHELDLSINSIGGNGVNGTIALAQSIGSMSDLEALDLSYNFIGGIGRDVGVIALSLALKPLSQIRSMDLSLNGIGPSVGLSALAGTFLHLTQLEHLALSSNAIGQDANTTGILVFAQNLRYLHNLGHLDIHGNYLGLLGSEPLQVLSESLSYMTELRYLNLGNNHIGSTNADGSLALGAALVHLNKLETFILKENNVGSTNALGANLIAQNLRYCRSLVSLDLGQNHLGLTSDVTGLYLNTSLSYLQKLTSFSLKDVDISYSARRGIANTLLASTHVTMIDFMQLTNEQSLNDFFSALPKNLTHLDLSGMLNIRNHTVYVSLMQKLAELPTLRTLNLSNNLLADDLINEQWSIEKNLKFLTTLELLDYSNNNIGSGEFMTEFLADSLAYLTKLRWLDLSKNQMGEFNSNGTRLLGASIGMLTELSYLDLSKNQMGLKDSEGVEALGHSLSNLSNLETLDLSYNHIGLTSNFGAFEIGKGLSELQNLTSLSFRSNVIGHFGPAGLIKLAQGIALQSRLSSIDMSINSIGHTGNTGPLAIVSALVNLTDLRSVNLGYNLIGFSSTSPLETFGQALPNFPGLENVNLESNSFGRQGQQGALMLGEGLKSLTHLKTFNVQQNQFGTHSQAGFNALVQSLIELPSLSTIRLDGNPEVSISWSALAPLQSRADSQALENACLASLCYSKKIAVKPAPFSLTVSKDMITNNLSNEAFFSGATLVSASLEQNDMALGELMPQDLDDFAITSSDQYVCQSWSFFDLSASPLLWVSFCVLVIALICVRGCRDALGFLTSQNFEPYSELDFMKQRMQGHTKTSQEGSHCTL